MRHCDVCGIDYDFLHLCPTTGFHYTAGTPREAYEAYLASQPKLASFGFEVWIEKLEMYVQERFNGRETGL